MTQQNFCKTFLALLIFGFVVSELKADCPNLEGTYTGKDIRKVEFTSTIQQKGCETLEITDSRQKEKIQYLMNGNIEEDPQHVKGGSNASHVRGFFAGNFVVFEKYKTKEENGKTVYSKASTLLYSVSAAKDEPRTLSVAVFTHSLDKDTPPFVYPLTLTEKK